MEKLCTFSLLTFGIIIGIFPLKLILGSPVSISARTLCLGGVVALALGVVLLLCKKPHILSVFSILMLVAWMILRGDSLFSSALYAVGAVGLILSIPFTAWLLSRIPNHLNSSAQ